MKTAYLYVRVSMDEQKKKGYSLPEQEDRLSKYCKYNNIEVRGIYREDFSAKNFARPESKKLISVIKNKSSKEDKNILFINETSREKATNMNFIDKKVSVGRAIAILAKNGVEVGEEEAAVILDFLYLMAKNNKMPDKDQTLESLRGNRTSKKLP